MAEHPTVNDIGGSLKKPAAKRPKKTYWDSVPGWKPADIADGFLLGAMEGGFAGLEILEDPTVLEAAGVNFQTETGEGEPPKTNRQKNSSKKQPHQNGHTNLQEQEGGSAKSDGAQAAEGLAAKKRKRAKRQQGDAAEATQDDPAAVPKRKQRQKKRRKKKEDAAGATGNGGSNAAAADMAALLARVQELEKENQALKQQQDGKADPAGAPPPRSGPPSPPLAATPSAKSSKPPKAKKAARHKTAAAADAAADVAAAGDVAVDVSSWQPYMLHPSILGALGRMGFYDPTPIQQACLPAAIRDKRDIIGAAQTGSGKTLAFALPILNQLVSEATAAADTPASSDGAPLQRPLRALILAPTRELALQVCSHMQAIGKVCRVRCEAIVGGLAAVKQERLLRGCPPVVVATPGRLWELMAGGDPHLSVLDHLSFFVLDEADRMVQQGHYQELTHILNLLPHPDRSNPDPEKFEDDFSNDRSKTLKRVTKQLRKKRHGQEKWQEGSADEDAEQEGGKEQDGGNEWNLMGKERRIKNGVGEDKGAKQVRKKGEGASEVVRVKDGDGVNGGNGSHKRGSGLDDGGADDEHDGIDDVGEIADIDNDSDDDWDDDDFDYDNDNADDDDNDELDDGSHDEVDAGTDHEIDGTIDSAFGNGVANRTADEIGNEVMHKGAKRSKGSNGRAASKHKEANNNGTIDKKNKGTELAVVSGHKDAGKVEEGSKAVAVRKRHLLQTFVFSATLTLPSSMRKRMKKKLGGAGGSATLESLMDRITFRGRPAVVDLTPSNKLAEAIQEAQVQCLDEEREHVLYYLLACHPGRTIVFANAVSAIRRLAALLRILGLPASALHAQQQQRQRLKALDTFRSRPDGVLVATDVAARGLDVKDVSTVVHFQLPPSVDTYIHRCGRTGRMHQDGVSIALVTPKETQRFSLLCQSLGRPPPPSFPVDLSVLSQAERRWKLALKIDSIEHQLKKATADRTWAQRTAALVGLDVSDDGLGSDDQVDHDKIRGLERRGIALRTGQLNSAASKQLRAQLAQLMLKPLQPKINRNFFTGGASMLALQANSAAQPSSGAAAKRNHTPSTPKPGGVAADAAPAALVTSAMAQTLALAKHLAANASAQPTKARVGAKGQAGAKQGHNARRRAQKDPVAARLALAREMLKKKQSKKQQKSSQSKMLVIPQGTTVRNLHGPNAVQALQQQLRK